MLLVRRSPRVRDNGSGSATRHPGPTSRPRRHAWDPVVVAHRVDGARGALSVSHARRPALLDRRSGHGRLAASASRPDARHDSNHRVDASALLHTRLGVVESTRDRRGRSPVAFGSGWHCGGAGLLPRGTGVRLTARRAPDGRAGGGESGPGLVLTGGTIVFAAGSAERANALVLRSSPALADAISPRGVVDRLRGRTPDALLRWILGVRRGCLSVCVQPPPDSHRGCLHAGRAGGCSPRAARSASACAGSRDVHRLNQPWLSCFRYGKGVRLRADRAAAGRGGLDRRRVDLVCFHAGGMRPAAISSPPWPGCRHRGRRPGAAIAACGRWI